MSKLFKIFAASVGSGMALGWGVRALTEASHRGRDLSPSPSGGLQKRLNAMEDRLEAIEKRRVSGNPLPEASLDAVVLAAERKLHSAAESLRETVVEEAGARIQGEAVAAVERAIAGSLGQRLGNLEASVETHELRMRELRECALQTEQNLQKLMSGIERLVNSQNRAAVPVPEAHREHRLTATVAL